MEKKALKYYQDKLFIGGLSFKTTDQSLEKYFSKYGPIKQANVMKYTDRQVSRGFGFCIFEDPQSAELAMETKTHIIDGRKVDVRWALPKEMAPPPQASTEQTPKSSIRKIFVGGLSVDTHDNDLRGYFSQFGEIENASVMYHHDKRHSRGFGFVLFKSSSSVNTLMQAGPHIIRNKVVDVKKAYPKDELANHADPSETIQEPLLPQDSARLVTKQSFGYSSPLSGEFNHSPTNTESSKLRSDLQLEFFDEQDNVQLPTYSSMTSLSSGYPYSTNYPYDPYSGLDSEWNAPTKSHYVYDPLSFRQSPSQFNSISGEQETLPFASSGGTLSQRNSLSASFGMHASMLPMDQSNMPAYSSRHDRSFFDSVGSTGSRNGLKRHSHFASQHAFLGSDSGLDDYNHDSHFYSNGGRIGFAPDLMDGYQSGHGLDSEYHDIRGYTSQLGVLHNRFDPMEGEEIDSIMNESIGRRTFSKQRRSKNHLLVSNTAEDSISFNPLEHMQDRCDL